MRKKLILRASKRMDDNRKEGRNENGLIRMSAVARDYMGFHDEQVELWPANSKGVDRINKAILLKIFHAFSKDLKEARSAVDKDQYKRIGFVTTKTFNRICGGDREVAKNIWISDTVHDTVLGADPEFMLLDSEKNVIYASNVISYTGEIGSDGPLAELRPKPEISTEALVENLLHLLKIGKTHDIDGYHWVGGCYHHDGSRSYPIGGHIHVGNPVQLVRKGQPTKMGCFKVINKILDEFLTVPLIKLDGPDGCKRRDKSDTYSGFGCYGDFRTGAGRLEHRAMSGMWLTHPSVSRAVLGSVKAVVDEIFRFISENKFAKGYILPDTLDETNLYAKSFNSWNKIPLAVDLKCTESSKFMAEALVQSDPKLVDKAFVNALHKKFKGLSTYTNYQHYIDGLCEILKVGSKELDAYSRDLKRNWLVGKKYIVDV